MIDHTQLLLGHYALRETSLEQRCAAAAAAGFSGISVSWPELCASTGAPAATRRQLQSAGLVASQLEIVRLPTANALAGFEDEALRATSVASELKCPVVVAVSLDPAARFDDVLRGFAVLADKCGTAGRRCAIEFVPYLSAVPDLPTAVRLLRAVDNPAAGIVIDCLHFFRSGAHWQDLACLRPDDIAVVQICDGPNQQPPIAYHEEAMHRRNLPGEGELDLCRLLRTLDRTGVSLPLTVEVMSDELMQLDPRDAARRMAESARSLLLKFASGPAT